MDERLIGRLRVRFGLKDAPDEHQITRWFELTAQGLRAGLDEDDAANEAAKQAFGELHQVRLYSQMDTIASLLAQARAHAILTETKSNADDRTISADQVQTR